MKIAFFLLVLLSILYVQVEAKESQSKDPQDQRKKLDRPNDAGEKRNVIQNQKGTKKRSRNNKIVVGGENNHKAQKVDHQGKHSKGKAPNPFRKDVGGEKKQRQGKRSQNGDGITDILCIFYNLIAAFFPLDFLKSMCAASNGKPTTSKPATTSNSNNGNSSQATTAGPAGSSSNAAGSTSLAVTTTAPSGPNPYCSIPSCSTQSSNTLCRFSPTTVGSACAPLDQAHSVVSQADIDLILSVSNNFRIKVATGSETRGSPGPQPAASNMRKLVWDAELAKMAQTWAQQCTFGHDTCRDVSRFYSGQSIYMSFNTVASSTADWTNAITAWYNEVDSMTSAYVSSFPSNPPNVVGHYTQLVWADTYTVGCGITFFQSTASNPTFPYKTYYVCNYGPGGNMIGSPVYKQGAAGSACPLGTTNNGGLCA